MTILATDNFVRANNTDLGTAWDPCTGDGSANGFLIQSNTAQPNSPSLLSDVSETNNSATFPNDQYCEVKFNATAADGVGTGSGAMVRAATGATVTRYRAIGSASGYEFLRFVTGTPSSLASGSGTTFTAADKLRVDVQTSGANCNWTLKKNGVVFASGTDTSPIASGRAGIAYSSTSSSAANAALSGFEAGDIPSGGMWNAGSEHPGQSPGLASAGSARFQTNWWPYSPPATPTDVTVALTGVQGTGAVGSVAVSFDLAQTGVVGTGSVGSVVPGISASVTGNTGTGSVGSVSFTNSPALVGVGGTGSVGTVAPLSGVPLAGTTATGSVGTLSPGSSLALTGNQGTGAVGTLAPSFDIGLSGVEGDSAVGTIVASVPGDVTVSLTGVEATSAVGTLTVSTDVVVPFVIGGGWIPLHKKKKKKKKPVIELDHVVIIPQETPDLDDKRIYRYVGDLSSELKNIRIQMVEAQDALEIAVRENKRIRNDEELLILLSI